LGFLCGNASESSSRNHYLCCWKAFCAVLLCLWDWRSASTADMQNLRNFHYRVWRTLGFTTMGLCERGLQNSKRCGALGATDIQRMCDVFRPGSDELSPCRRSFRKFRAEKRGNSTIPIGVFSKL